MVNIPLVQHPNKVLINHNNKHYTKDDVTRLLGLDEYLYSPSKYKFDNDNHLFFITNTASQSILNIHYVDIDSNNKTSDIKPLFTYRETNGEMSLEEELMRERQRIIGNGITSYELNEDSKQFLVAMGNDLYSVDISGSVQSPVLNKLDAGTFDSKLSHDGKLAAFIDNGDIWVTHLASGTRHRLTHARDISEFVSAGEAKFVYSEEFSRFTGYWWSPKLSDQQKQQYQIFYFEEDEREVRDFYIPQHGFHGTTTHYKYPLAGDVNSKVRLCLLTFSFDESGQINCEHKYLFDLKNNFDWLEYYVRGGWTNDGKAVYVQIMDRLQQRLELVVIPLAQFNSTPSNLPVLTHDQSNLWINVVDHLQFLTDHSLLWSSEETGYRHLYLVSWDANYSNVQKRQLTSGDWVVLDNVWVDQKRSLIYFEANADTPLETHLYVCSYAPDAKMNQFVRLTQPGYNHTSISVSQNFTRFVSNYSNILEAPQSKVFQLDFNNNNDGIQFPTATLVTTIFINKQLGSKNLRPGNLFNFVNSKGRKIYGRYHLPENYNSSILYPSVVCVYGGPHAQLVYNSYSTSSQFLSEFGFVTIYIDGTGSANRGLQFEAPLRESMGTVELQDQIEGVTYLAKNIINLDSDRVAIQGWSYGGYLSLMALAQAPEFFKIAISGAPVTLWESYNTGYTERYMNTPKNNPKGYKNGNVLNYIENFPDELNRLILIHGIQDENVHFANTSILVEELSLRGKPYILKILGKERHGIRDSNNRISIESFRVNHYLKNL